MKTLMVLGCIAVGFVILVWAVRRADSAVGKPCTVCGAGSSFGYSDHAEEDADKIRPLCLAHLIPELKSD